MNSYAHLLKQSDIFYQFTAAQLDLVSPLCREVEFNAGDLIFPENSSSNDLYIIVRGEVDVVISITGPADGAESSTLARLRRGQSFGEIALVDQGLRSASARAVENGTQLLLIPREQLLMLCETYPQLGFRLMYNLAADLAMKIRNADFRFREQHQRSSQGSG